MGIKLTVTVLAALAMIGAFFMPRLPLVVLPAWAIGGLLRWPAEVLGNEFRIDRVLKLLIWAVSVGAILWAWLIY